MEVMRIMQNQVQKKETEVQLLKDKQKELEFMNAMLSDRLALALKWFPNERAAAMGENRCVINGNRL